MLRLDRVRLPLAHFDLDLSFETTTSATGLFGPSGAGKTATLELIAGIRKPVAGRIVLDDTVADDAERGQHLRARHRRIGYVPQGESLFPHLNVEKNIRFGLRGDGSDAFLHHVVEVLELGPLMLRGVRALSGGEAKRVALARALVTSPRLLLLDEPLSGLDRPLHSRVIEFLIRVRDDLRVPMLYVSHDLDELKRVTGETIVVNQGRIVDRVA